LCLANKFNLQLALDYVLIVRDCLLFFLSEVRTWPPQSLSA
jgi:hypothetical protein